MKNTRLLTILIIVFIDLLGFTLILPLLPYYAESYGATPMFIGLFAATYLTANPGAFLFAGSLEAITRVIAPSVGGYLLWRLGIWAPRVFSALLMAWAVTFAYRKIIIPASRMRLVIENEGSHA